MFAVYDDETLFQYPYSEQVATPDNNNKIAVFSGFNTHIASKLRRLKTGKKKST